MLRTFIVATCCASALFLGVRSAIGNPTFTLLTPSSPNVGMAIDGVSGDGNYATGEMSNSSGTSERATRWTASNVTSDMGLLSGRPYSMGTYLDFNGSIGAADTYDSSSNSEIMQWTSPSTKVAVPFMGTGNYAYSAGISSDGSVVAGWGNITSSTTPEREMLWTSSGGVSIVPLPAGVASSYSAGPYYQYSRALSGNGQFLIGNTSNVTGTAFRYDKATGISSDIGQMQAGQMPELTSISNDGSTIIGTSNFQFTPAQGDIFAQVGFIWTQSSGFVNIGSLDSGLDALARFLSGNGQVVLGTSGGDNFIWTAASGMMNFNDFLAANGVNTPGLADLTISGVSDDGTTIVGEGVTDNGDGDQVGWILSGATIPVPEPASTALIFLVASFAFRRNRA